MEAQLSVELNGDYPCNKKKVILKPFDVNPQTSDHWKQVISDLRPVSFEECLHTKAVKLVAFHKSPRDCDCANHIKTRLTHWKPLSLRGLRHLSQMATKAQSFNSFDSCKRTIQKNIILSIRMVMCFPKPYISLACQKGNEDGK